VRGFFGSCSLGLLGIAMAAEPALSQAPARRPMVADVRVLDTAGASVEGADVAVVRGLGDRRASGTTDARGRASLSIDDAQGDYQLVVRKIGYNRSDQFFRGVPGRLSFDIVMHRSAQSLAPVRVTAREDLKRKSYFIDADEIAKHADELIDASDILRKLKPDMVCGRSCNPWGGVATRARSSARACPISTPNPGGCPRASSSPPSGGMSRTNAWVNGRRILMIDTDPVCQAGKRGALSGLSAGAMQVLCEILPEHIEQIQYVDEFDNSIGKVGSNSALFIVLKNGVVYEPGKVSYVRQPSRGLPGIQASVPGIQTTSSGTPDVLPHRDSTTAPHDSTAPLPAYRYRLLGVYDQDTGDVIEGARVVDVNTGSYVNTSPTGTVSLMFLPEGESLLRIAKPGYEDLNLTVDIGPTATTPLTLLMKKKPEDQ
jgi:hypothetical protein